MTMEAVDAWAYGTYEIRGREGPKKHVYNFHILDQVPVRIMRTNATGAPVALILRSENEITYRAKGDRWFTLFSSGDLNKFLEIISSTTYANPFLGGTFHTIESFQNKGGRILEFTGAEGFASKMQNAIDDFLIIEDLVHRTISEPTIRISRRRQEDEEILRIEVGVDHHGNGCIVFPCDQVDSALSLAETIAENHDLRMENNLPGIEVIDASGIKTNPVLLALKKASSLGKTLIASRSLHHLSDDAIQAALDLRRINPDEEDFSAVPGNLEILSQALKECDEYTAKDISASFRVKEIEMIGAHIEYLLNDHISQSITAFNI